MKLLAAGGPPRGVTAIARSLSLSPSSCLNILRTLNDQEFVNFDPREKTYTLGHGLVFLARQFSDSLDAFSVLRDELADISARFKATSCLWRYTHHARFVLLGSIESAAVTRIGLHTGQRIPMLSGAIGRCAAAYARLSSRELRRQYAAVQWHEKPDFDTFQRESEEARQRGWALDAGQLMSGITAVSAPILDPEGNLQYCISNVSFRGQHDLAAIQRLGEATRLLVRRCERRLYDPSSA